MLKFTYTPAVRQIIKRAHHLKDSGKRFSDIEDSKGHQYVDLVQEGGGVLGIALTGYTYVLENAGIRFFSLAGTSAGAINTMLIAALGKIEEPKSEKILQILSRKNLFELVDGSRGIRKVIQSILRKDPFAGWTIALNAFGIYRAVTNKLGLNPGKDFEKWITAELQKAGIHNLKDLEERRTTLPEELKCVTGASVDDLKAKLCIITSDITTHSKVDFPQMAELYWKDPETINPALLVRASMSIPFFFEPFSVKDIPNAGMTNDANWDKYARYYGEVPDIVRFVDGGMLSNFPINVFHLPDGVVPRMPTFGARLSAYRESYSNTSSLIGMNGAMISTMRQIHDYDFLLKNPDYRKLICRIDADEKFNWLDFNMPENEQVALFELGARKAIEFLEEFNWEEYKELRRSLGG